MYIKIDIFVLLKNTNNDSSWLFPKFLNDSSDPSCNELFINEFPGIEGFSRVNIFRMKAFFSAYEKIAQAVRQLESLPIFLIPWGHNILLFQKIKDIDERLWYASKAIEHGWSRSMLTIWIENDLYRREGKAITNFKAVLPALQSDLAQQTTKDLYSC
jgi:predicted nuclease of restriction endonuclease-like (RecB) superfamily